LAPRFDPETLTLDLSVADLLDATLLRHIGFGNRGGYERLWLGQAIHSRYQEAALAADPSYAASRQMVVLWLGKTKQHRDRAVDVLLGLLDQDDVNGHAVKALAQLKDPRSVEGLRRMTADSRAWVRNAAKRTVERLV